MKPLVILSLSSFLTACVFVHTPEATYITVGHAKVEECNSIVHVDGKEDIKFNCKDYSSEGISTGFASVLTAFVAVVTWPF